MTIETLGIVGAGAMGRGIAQIAAQAGLRVRLYDSQPAALELALAGLRDTFDKLAGKGRMSAADASGALDRVLPCALLDEMAACELVIEAIVERLDAKRDLFARLEEIVRSDALLASNTSSLSITAIAAACKSPGRVAGYHFFNPVPLMKVVEVIDGLRSAPATGDALMALAVRLGHTPVRCKDMPGFIVNHAGRGMNTEGLRIVQEGVASFADVDAIMREQAGFRMGPFELMDLTGLDVSQPVMESIYRQFYDEPRFRPSPIAALRVAGGLLGRKTGEGFYAYPPRHPQPAARPAAPHSLPASVWVSPADARGHAMLSALLATLPATLETGERPSADALIVVTPLGSDATRCAVEQRLDAARLVALDTLHAFDIARRRTVMGTPMTLAERLDAAEALFASDNAPVTRVRDSGGFVAQRIVACIVNIACDIAQQRIAAPADIDRAVQLGLGYPMGPLAMGDALGPALLLQILRNLQKVYGDPRYRPSPWLARRAQLGMSLLIDEA